MKKWFNFKGTIDGLTFFARPLLGLLFFIPAMLLEGWSEVTPNEAPLYYLLFSIPAIWLSLSTTNKRINALFSNNKAAAWIAVLIPYVGFIMNIILIAKNSKIEKHNG